MRMAQKETSITGPLSRTLEATFAKLAVFRLTAFVYTRTYFVRVTLYIHFYVITRDNFKITGSLKASRDNNQIIHCKLISLPKNWILYALKVKIISSITLCLYKILMKIFWNTYTVVYFICCFAFTSPRRSWPAILMLKLHQMQIFACRVDVHII